MALNAYEHAVRSNPPARTRPPPSRRACRARRCRRRPAVRPARRGRRRCSRSTAARVRRRSTAGRGVSVPSARHAAGPTRSIAAKAAARSRSAATGRACRSIRCRCSTRAVNRTTPEDLPGRGDGTRASAWRSKPAIDAYTSSAAWASFDDQRKGTIAPGMLADLVVLSDDVLDAPTAKLESDSVTVTIFDGKIVYRRDAPRAHRAGAVTSALARPDTSPARRRLQQHQPCRLADRDRRGAASSSTPAGRRSGPPRRSSASERHHRHAGARRSCAARPASADRPCRRWSATICSSRRPSTSRTRRLATMPMSAMNGGTPAPLMTVAFLTST